MSERANLKAATHAVEQADKHVRLMTERPGDAQYHLDRIAELVVDASKVLGRPATPKAPERAAQPNPKIIPLEPDWEEALWREVKGSGR